MRSDTNYNITVIGAGLIGASWTALFLAHGHRVCVHDVAPGFEARVRMELTRIKPTLLALGLTLDDDHHKDRLSFEPDLAKAVRNADFVQECGPERIAFKRQLWAQVEQHCPATALLLSSSSGLTASRQAKGMRTPHRMLVGHPFNPPHLIPLVEVVPGQQTLPDAVDAAMRFYTSLGKKAILVKKEIPGFVANRLQAAVIRESVSLVQQGVITAGDLDDVMTHSLGIRWAVGGPFISAHLGGGAGGIKAFFKQFGSGLQLLWLHSRLRPVLLTQGTRDNLDAALQGMVQGASVAELESARDQQQLALLTALQTSKAPAHD